MPRPVSGLIVAICLLSVGCSASAEAKAKTSVTKYLAKRLNDPESYREAEWGKLTAVSDCPTVKHYIQHQYRAKNQLGGYVAADEFFLLADSFDVVVAVSQEDMFKLARLARPRNPSTAEIIREYIDKP